MLKYVANNLIYLALAAWLGSIVFFGAGVASVLFKPGMLPSRSMAGAINSAILGRLGTIEVAAGVVLAGCALYAAFKYGHWMNWAVLVLSIGMLGTTLYYTNVLFPEMDALRVSIGDFDHISAENSALKERFDSGHQRYSMLAKGVLLGGVLVLILHTSALVMRADRSSRRSPAVSAPVGAADRSPTTSPVQKQKVG